MEFFQVQNMGLKISDDVLEKNYIKKGQEIWLYLKTVNDVRSQVKEWKKQGLKGRISSYYGIFT